MKNFGKKGAWAYPGTAQFFWVPLYYLRNGYIATDFKFGGDIYRANPNKSQLKTLETRKRGRIQGLFNYLGTPCYLRNG